MTKTKPSTPAIGDPEQAWKVLAVVTEWVRHAESKAAATLATAGVVCGILYSLLKDQHYKPDVVIISAIICGFLTLSAALFAGFALVPRIWRERDPVNSLYFDHIARSHPRSGGSSSYSLKLHSLITNDGRLVNEIADQVWANSHIARDKFRWVNLGVLAILLALLALAVTALSSLIQK